ncbi:MAG: response regulator transcription factor [Pseudoclavibacter sp.]
MIHVMLVDDEAFTLELHRDYVGRVEGFRVVAEARGARPAIAALAAAAQNVGGFGVSGASGETGAAGAAGESVLAGDSGASGRRVPASPRIDLVLLDMTMPDGSGLDVLRHARAMASPVDVIALTGVRDPETVRQVVALGAVNYVVKPFTFALLRERLEQYRDYRARVRAASGSATQGEIDAMLGALRPSVSPALPKGLTPESLARVLDVVRRRGTVTAAEAAEWSGMSRVAVRRYLEFLAEQGQVERGARYGTGGRPVSEYRWRGDGAGGGAGGRTEDTRNT